MIEWDLKNKVEGKPVIASVVSSRTISNLIVRDIGKIVRITVYEQGFVEIDDTNLNLAEITKVKDMLRNL